jgi:hypothetical protein
MGTRGLKLWAWGGAVAVLALLFAAAVIGLARAQSLEEGRAWIHVNGRECCPHQNCFPAPQATLGADGWRVPGLAGTLHPLAARPWPFPDTWACYYPHDPAKTLRCVFAPPPEAS